MKVEIPSDYGMVVQRLISDGKFNSESEVIAEGLRLIVMREKLHQEIQVGLDDLEAGNRVAAGEVYDEAKRRIKAIGERSRPWPRSTIRRSRRLTSTRLPNIS